MLGEKFGEYEIVRLIGRGGMGAVYEALNANINRRAAIKVLHPEFTKEDDAVRRFFNEARAVNTINHPGVVQVSDLGKRPDGSLYLVMELLEGETLTERLQNRGGKLPEREVVTISWQLAGVLAAAHAKSIIHRDLKPGNMMLVPDMAGPDGERVKLLDFGIAKLGGTVGEDADSRNGQVLGTATYMAPEQFQSDLAPDGQSDVYCLAIVMFRMVSGKVPFTSTSGELGLAAMHMFQKAPSLKEVAPEASGWLVELVDSMLRKDREKRPTMAEVLDELQRHVSFRPAKNRVSSSLVRISPSDFELVMDDGGSSDDVRPVATGASPPASISQPGTFSSASVQLKALGNLWAARKPLVAAGGVAVAVLLISLLLMLTRRPGTQPETPTLTAGQPTAPATPPAAPPKPPSPATPASTEAGPAQVENKGVTTPSKPTGATRSAARGGGKKDAKGSGGKKRALKIIN